MQFNPLAINLPIAANIVAIRKQLQNKNTLIVNAPPGAGKSTLLPLALMEEPWLGGKKIIMLEPRRLAAKTIAMRQAELLGESLGGRVGYRIRFDNKIGKHTQIEVVTEGILTRMLQQNNALDEVGLVIFDEFHERSLFTDVALALCRESQQVLRPDLRILIMSATLDMPQLVALLNTEAVISEGRQFPIEIKYTQNQDLAVLPELVAKTIGIAIAENSGDILAFLPGEGEIRSCEALVKRQQPDIAVYPLYGQLPPAKQIAAILPRADKKRKVVLATSIAETSLTIEGIKVVIDSGYTRTLSFNPVSGLSKLETNEITLDVADQRAGRAGRLEPGVCYRMWSQATHNRLAKHRKPEILEADLCSLMLDLAQWGNTNVGALTWLTPPPKTAVNEATNLLEQLGALDDNRITSHGIEMRKLPCHPRIAHMLIMAKQYGLQALATDVAGIIEERDPLDKTAGIDINLRIEAIRRYRAGTLNNKKLQFIEKVARQYREMLGISCDNGMVNPYETGLLLVFAYPERIAFAKPGNNALFMMTNGNLAVADHKDDLAHEPWLAIAHVVAREGTSKIFMASPLNPTDLAPMVKEKTLVEWNTKKGGLIAVVNQCIGTIVLQSRPLINININQKIDAISKAIEKEGEQLLNFTEEVIQWQNRVLSLRIWDTEGQWPDVSTSKILVENKEWLSPYLQQVKRPDDLKRINLLEALMYHLSYDKQQRLTVLAPERIIVPSGSAIKINYFSNGESPVLAVRLQEVFGMQETPSINNGKVKVLMHLLSPGFKQVQITGDLKSFWDTAYFQIKGELRRRYPKHEWPENPLTAVPVRGVTRAKK